VSEIDQAETNFAAEPTTKLKSFAPTELVACEQCSRANAPSRSTCIYCGAELPAAVAVKAADKTHEAGPDAVQHVLFITADQLAEMSTETCSRLANLLGLGLDDVSSAMAAGGPLPLTAASSTAQAQTLSAAIRALGFHASILLEESLAHKHARKIRGLELSTDSISALPQKSAASVFAWSDISLIVVGRLITTRIEVDEKRRRRDSTPIDSRQFSTHEAVADIYLGPEAAWRISADNFDYSCLGDRKAATGFENFRRLLELIRERAPHVEINDSYLRKRILLANVWPLEEESRNDVLFGTRRRNRQSVKTSNESQFSRYSRVAWLLKINAAEFTP
jgi:hypothetical protein